MWYALGVNLRMAQVNGFNKIAPGNSIDSVVHAICKLLGHLGSNPEYGKGVVTFPAALEDVGDTDEERSEALKEALGVRLDRQVGSRYFITSRNAGRIFYLRDLALQFVNNLNLAKELNGLEKEVQQSLQDTTKLALLKADALFFDKIYADLMMLLKSNKLGKKLLDMNKHYLELLHYLEEISKHPRLILDPSHHVFPSEPKLYNNSQTNH